MTTRNSLLKCSLHQRFDGEPLGGGAAWNNSISRRSFLKRTGGATAATLLTWHSLQSAAKADGSPPAAGGSDIRYVVSYIFSVRAAPDNTNPEQIEAGWKNKKIPASGDQPANTIKGGTWHAGINEFYAHYQFTADGPPVGDRSSVSFSGTAKGWLYEDDPGDTNGGYFEDDDDLEAEAEAAIGARTWTINNTTGEITKPGEQLSIENLASPGSGYAKAGVSLGEFVGRVKFDYSYVDGWSGSAAGTAEGGEGAASANYAKDSTSETVFGFVWVVKVKKITRVYRMRPDSDFISDATLINESFELLDPS